LENEKRKAKKREKRKKEKQQRYAAIAVWSLYFQLICNRMIAESFQTELHSTQLYLIKIAIDSRTATFSDFFSLDLVIFETV